MTDEELTAAAERFCATPLPESVCADLVAIKPMKGRTGTNLLTVAEAKIMLAAALATPPAPNDDLRAALEWLRQDEAVKLKVAQAIIKVFAGGSPDLARLVSLDWCDWEGEADAAIKVIVAALKENRRG